MEKKFHASNSLCRYTHCVVGGCLPKAAMGRPQRFFCRVKGFAEGGEDHWVEGLLAPNGETGFSRKKGGSLFAEREGGELSRVQKGIESEGRRNPHLKDLGAFSQLAICAERGEAQASKNNGLLFRIEVG